MIYEVREVGNVDFAPARHRNHLRRLLVKCGMRKVKCGIENCGNGCGMVGKTRNAEIVHLPI